MPPKSCNSVQYYSFWLDRLLGEFGHPQSSAFRFLLSGETLLSPSLDVNFGKPAARLDELHDIEQLLDGHDGKADAGDGPRYKRVHLICSSDLESGCAEGIGKDLS